MAQARTTSSRSARGDVAVLGAGVRVRGRISGEGDLTIEGTVEGDILVRGELTVADGASVTSEQLEASSVTLGGQVQSHVNATGPVRVLATARVRGDLRGSEISIEEGAQVSGRIDAEFELPPELGGGRSR